ncbi:MAG: hypothetical protein J7L54_02480 [Elusimicrobia bacterium]|nr:hypothetical protein [Elusimicrobiota bacterium]
MSRAKGKPRQGKAASRKNGKIIVVGISLLVLSFFNLSMVNSDATNFAGRIASFLFVLSWVTIFYGILKGK